MEASRLELTEVDLAPTSTGNEEEPDDHEQGQEHDHDFDEFDNLPSQSYRRLPRRCCGGYKATNVCGVVLLVAVTMTMVVVGNLNDWGTSSSPRNTTPVTATSSSQYKCVIPSLTCLTDRLGNTTPLLAGTAICNKQHQFGLATDGSLVLQSCFDTTSTGMEVESAVVLHKHETAAWFTFAIDGSLELWNAAGEMIWSAESVIVPITTLYPKCLKNPALDCPYLHLHQNGDLVVNSINDQGWSDRKIQKCFPSLFPSTTTAMGATTDSSSGETVSSPENTPASASEETEPSEP